jgi:hypothetical protein
MNLNRRMILPPRLMPTVPRFRNDPFMQTISSGRLQRLLNINSATLSTPATEGVVHSGFFSF